MPKKGVFKDKDKKRALGVKVNALREGKERDDEDAKFLHVCYCCRYLLVVAVGEVDQGGHHTVRHVHVSGLAQLNQGLHVLC